MFFFEQDDVPNFGFPNWGDPFLLIGAYLIDVMFPILGELVGLGFYPLPAVGTIG